MSIYERKCAIEQPRKKTKDAAPVITFIADECVIPILKFETVHNLSINIGKNMKKSKNINRENVFNRFFLFVGTYRSFKRFHDGSLRLKVKIRINNLLRAGFFFHAFYQLSCTKFSVIIM